MNTTQHGSMNALTCKGLTEDEANASIRFSFGYYNKKSEIDACLPILIQAAEHLRTMSLTEQHSH